MPARAGPHRTLARKSAAATGCWSAFGGSYHQGAGPWMNPTESVDHGKLVGRIFRAPRDEFADQRGLTRLALPRQQDRNAIMDDDTRMNRGEIPRIFNNCFLNGSL